MFWRVARKLLKSADGRAIKGNPEAKIASVEVCGLEAAACNISSPTADDVEGTYQAMDTNQDGQISVEEFQVLVVEILKTLAEQE